MINHAVQQSVRTNFDGFKCALICVCIYVRGLYRLHARGSDVARLVRLIINAPCVGRRPEARGR
jgi:hypothetical protein